MNEIADMFANAIEIDHLTDEEIQIVLEMFGDNN